MKFFGWSLLMVRLTICFSQPVTPVPGVLQAERNFADYSLKNGTKEAFMSFLGGDAVVFEDGKPTNGLELWKSRSDNPALLFWWPVRAGISLSGDFGYTTGPYYVSADRKGNNRVAFGYYATVWKKDDKGEWKVAIDLGVSSPSIDSSQTEVSIMKVHARKVAEAALDELLDRDEQYSDKLNRQGRSFLKSFVAADGSIHRNGAAPFVGAASFKNIAATGSFIFEPVDGEMATSGDLGYTYGNVVMRKKGTEPQQLNYLRVWRKDKYGAWFIVLDVIGG